VFLRVAFEITLGAIAEAAEVIGLPALRIVPKVVECQPVACGLSDRILQ
jgi:hypothetical protein